MFDRTEALEKAMEVFWQQGFEGSSMTDLTTAMGISSPSLYAAFRSKEALYLEAVRHFSETSAAGIFRALMEAPTLREGLAGMLNASIGCSTQPGRPQGCMIALGATHCAPENERIRQELKEMRRTLQDTLRLKFETAISDGLLPPDVDAASLAAYYATVVHGLSIQARDGATCDELTAILAHALAPFDRITRVNDPVGLA
ncbi:TetR/AcrR family transcriptional regulator [Microvirga rosea]|uniref:TetR/AcrR family transcriptional regulator n=1 Tax=Microvirga rosea TaxID=2715425 RepID=UPI001D0B50CE|nr:TetR/AcrR family transcriptional regulator [Microvirga rosea]MCB8822928.1 TetR/AcrR family transcriptional regulator [Microvirga rosea]